MLEFPIYTDGLHSFTAIQCNINGTLINSTDNRLYYSVNGKCLMLDFSIKDLPGLDNLKIEMDMNGCVTCNHENPIKALKDLVKWHKHLSKEKRICFLGCETVARLLLSYLIVQKEF